MSLLQDLFYTFRSLCKPRWDQLFAGRVEADRGIARDLVIEKGNSLPRIYADDRGSVCSIREMP